MGADFDYFGRKSEKFLFLQAPAPYRPLPTLIENTNETSKMKVIPDVTPYWGIRKSTYWAFLVKIKRPLGGDILKITPCKF